MGINLSNKGIYFIIDKYNSHNGITDRLKAAVGLYYIAKQNHVPFHFIHHAGFDIRDYLKPNKVSWSAELSDVSSIPWKKRQLEYLLPLTSIPRLNPNLQYVCKKYIGKNIIEILNVPDWQHVWRELFWELFTPGDNVLNVMVQSGFPEHYVAVNVRFINSLGVNEQAGYNTPLSGEMQHLLMEKVVSKVFDIQREADVPVILSSDSVYFLKEAAGRGIRTIDHTGVGHIMNPGVDEKINLYTFVNFFLLSRADKIYSILNVESMPKNSLYKSQYPRYAAIIGDKTFIRI